MNKHIIVTGSSRGIGYELVKILAEQGHRIYALSRNQQPIAQLNLKNVHSLSCDLSDESSIDKTIDFIKSQSEYIDVLVNNAGHFLNQAFEDTNIDDVKAVYETNIFGVFTLTSKLIKTFPKINHTVNISSMGGIQGSVKFPGLAAYSSSKAALICLTELLAEEYKESDMAFNCLALGAVQTEMLEEAFPGMQAPVSAQEMATYIANFALTGQQLYNGKTLQVSNSTP
ncbi:SDR family NAD(P)-dependent oxidoreductase [Mesohalobacter halotolerans]|uniref:SDR family oxidoreductase n=1 Tax=Mesohalobacter halotolerans TaxID=1883405 RepID=A0A4U5TS59_9FLAO|nr:SDR family oxidoreductase [Mesohalobacter halotolerans]TKS56244.1 SDR family oxidoreductase [Mesohalobacter halotolerans]